MQIADLIRRLFGSGKPEQRQGSAVEMAKWNVNCSLFMLPIIFIFQVVNVLRVLVFSRKGLSNTTNLIYFCLYLFIGVLSLLGIAYALYSRRHLERCAPTIMNAAALYSAACCAWGVAITLMDLRVKTNIMVYMLAIITVAVVFYVKPWHAVIIFLCCYALLAGLAPAVINGREETGGLLVNMSVLLIVSICMSISRFCGKEADYENRMVILRQNEKINKINQQLNTLVMTDTLSGMYNRRFLTEIFPDKWSECSEKKISLAVIMVDIDDFKMYNDTYGHQAGDECIRQITRIMQESSRTGFDWAFRYGGEEFSVVMMNATIYSACALAERIRGGVEALRIMNEKSPLGYITVSEGVYAALPADGETPQNFFARSDEALYQAKSAGKNCVIAYEKPVTVERTSEWTNMDSISGN